jgi:hypothetical protein
MCDGELRGGVSDKNEGKRTLADPVARTMAHAGGVAMPPPVRQPQPQLEQLRELERKLEEEQQQQ